MGRWGLAGQFCLVSSPSVHQRMAGTGSSEGLTGLDVQEGHSHVWKVILPIGASSPVHEGTRVGYLHVPCAASQSDSFCRIHSSSELLPSSSGS